MLSDNAFTSNTFLRSCSFACYIIEDVLCGYCLKFKLLCWIFKKSNIFFQLDSAVHNLEEGKVKLQNTENIKNIEESANKVKAIDRSKTKPDKHQETKTNLISTNKSEQKEPSYTCDASSKVISGQITETRKLNPASVTISDKNLSKVSKSSTPQNLIENTINETSSTPETKKNNMFALENAKSEVMKANMTS